MEHQLGLDLDEFGLAILDSGLPDLIASGWFKPFRAHAVQQFKFRPEILKWELPRFENSRNVEMSAANTYRSPYVA